MTELELESADITVSVTGLKTLTFVLIFAYWAGASKGFDPGVEKLPKYPPLETGGIVTTGGAGTVCLCTCTCTGTHSVSVPSSGSAGEPVPVPVEAAVAVALAGAEAEAERVETATASARGATLTMEQ